MLKNEEKLNQLLDSYDKDKKAKDVKEKRKTATIATSALLLAGIIALTTALSNCGKKEDKTNHNESETNEPYKIVKIEEYDLSKLGKKLNIPSKKDSELEQYGDVEVFDGKEPISVEDLTIGVDPKTNETVIFKDEDAANKANNIGKVEYDTQKDEYVDSEGNVRKNEPGYEVVDPKTGNVETGNGDIPSGYVEKTDDNGQTIYVESDKADTYFFADKDYWTFDENGNPYIIFKKGDRIDKQEFELLKDILFDYKPSKSENNTVTVETYVETGEPIYETEIVNPEPITSSTYTEVETPEPKPTTTVDEYGGIINPNGTYTLGETTFKDKDTFLAFLLDENSDINFGYYNGIIYPISDINEMNEEMTKSR